MEYLVFISYMLVLAYGVTNGSVLNMKKSYAIETYLSSKYQKEIKIDSIKLEKKINDSIEFHDCLAILDSTLRKQEKERDSIITRLETINETIYLSNDDSIKLDKNYNIDLAIADFKINLIHETIRELLDYGYINKVYAKTYKVNYNKNETLFITIENKTNQIIAISDTIENRIYHPIYISIMENFYRKEF